MRWCRFAGGRFGVVQSGNVYEVTDRFHDLASRRGRAVGDSFVAALPDLAQCVPDVLRGPAVGTEDEIAFDSPVQEPTKIIGAPVNYASHVREARDDVTVSQGRPIAGIDEAGLFLKATSCLVGPSAGIALRFPHRRTDHEVEVGVIIGRSCSDVPIGDALDCIAGYAIAIDVTLRGPEDRSFRKSIDTYGVLGPYLLTPDEVGDPRGLDFSLAVNGEIKQVGSTKAMIRDIAHLVSWASEWYTLHPGDVIMTGTPEGAGPLKAGDVVECRLEPSTTTMTVHVRAHEPGRAVR